MSRFKQFYLKERKEKKVYQYSSSQFDLPLDISQQIYDWGLKNIPEGSVDIEDGRQPVNDLHITVKYGLVTEYFESLEPLAQCFKPFTIKLGKMSLFNLEEKDVLKLEIEQSDVLKRMNQFIKNNLENIETYPVYVPHATICFVKKNSCNHLVGNSSFEGYEIPVNGISFSSKNGFKTFIPFIPETYSPPIGRFDYRFRS